MIKSFVEFSLRNDAIDHYDLLLIFYADKIHYLRQGDTEFILMKPPDEEPERGYYQRLLRKFNWGEPHKYADSEAFHLINYLIDSWEYVDEAEFKSISIDEPQLKAPFPLLQMGIFANQTPSQKSPTGLKMSTEGDLMDSLRHRPSSGAASPR